MPMKCLSGDVMAAIAAKQSLIGVAAVTKRKADIIRPDQRIAAQVETLAFLFDCSVSTIERAVANGLIKPSERLGVKLFSIDEMKSLVFANEIESLAEVDPSVEAVNATKKVTRS